MPDEDDRAAPLGPPRLRRRPATSTTSSSDPPKHDEVCDVDGSRLIQRDDDREETVRNRLQVYHEQTAPLIDYYDDRGLLHRFDGTRSPTEVHDHIRATIGRYAGGPGRRRACRARTL